MGLSKLSETDLLLKVTESVLTSSQLGHLVRPTPEQPITKHPYWCRITSIPSGLPTASNDIAFRLRRYAILGLVSPSAPPVVCMGTLN